MIISKKIRVISIFKYDDYKCYIKFPDDLKSRYQPFTQSSNDNIKSLGYDNKFYSIEQGVNKYLKYLDKG